MAISANGGTSGNSSSAVSSLALTAFTPVTGEVLVLAVALGSTSSSVSSIGASAGSYTWTLRSSNNGTGVRVEIWTATVNTGAATTFTVNITGGATTVAAGIERYGGVASIGNSTNANGSSEFPRGYVTIADGNNWLAAAVGFACQSGDTITGSGSDLTNRQSSIPSATAVAVQEGDNSSSVDCSLIFCSKLSNSRNWAVAAVELVGTGNVPVAIATPMYGGTLVAALQVANNEYLEAEMPLFCQSSGTPSPGTTNYGFVS